MKKLFILASLIFALPFVANAASFVITPSSGSYTNGDIVTLRISVDPAGSTIYTAMLDAKFSQDTFEVVSFTLNDSMLAMKQTGYDSTDNTNGILVKTGGYTGGITSTTSFGTLVLRAKLSGTGTFTANSNSKLLDSNNANKQVGSQSASFAIAGKVTGVEPKVEVQKSINTSTKTVTPTKKETTTKASTSNVSDITATSSQVAAVGQSGASGGVMLWVLGILAMVSMFVIGYVVGNRNLFKFPRV